jgi:hypothetical protein
MLRGRDGPLLWMLPGCLVSERSSCLRSIELLPCRDNLRRRQQSLLPGCTGLPDLTHRYDLLCVRRHLLALGRRWDWWLLPGGNPFVRRR